METRDLIRQWEYAIIGLVMCIGSIMVVVEQIQEDSGGYIGSLDALLEYFDGDALRWGIFAVAGFGCFVHSTYVLIQYYRGKDMDIWSEDEDEVGITTTAVPYVLKQGKFSIQFPVPGDYSWSKSDKPNVNEELGMVMFPRFTRKDGRFVDCQFHVELEEDVANGDNVDAKEDIQDQLGYLPEATRRSIKLREAVVDGKYIVHYFVTQEKSGFTKMQRLYATCDVEEGKYFTLEMWSESWEPKLDVKDFSQFFEFDM